MIEDSLKKHKHVMHYDTEIIPTKEEVEEILSIGKGIKFRKDVYRRSSMHMDTRPSFGTIFEFVEGETNEKL